MAPSERSTLTATSRLGLNCRARYTTPYCPLPSNDIILYLPTCEGRCTAPAADFAAVTRASSPIAAAGVSSSARGRTSLSKRRSTASRNSVSSPLSHSTNFARASGGNSVAAMKIALICAQRSGVITPTPESAMPWPLANLAPPSWCSRTSQLLLPQRSAPRRIGA